MSVIGTGYKVSRRSASRDTRKRQLQRLAG